MGATTRGCGMTTIFGITDTPLSCWFLPCLSVGDVTGATVSVFFVKGQVPHLKVACKGFHQICVGCTSCSWQRVLWIQCRQSHRKHRILGRDFLLVAVLHRHIERATFCCKLDAETLIFDLYISTSLSS
jgi:hypothetical protein